MYGELRTIAWNGPEKGKFTRFHSKAAVVMRDARAPAAKNSKPFWIDGKSTPNDLQGFTILSIMDTLKQTNAWQTYNVTFTAPSDKVLIAFATINRPKPCGSCGSFLDAVCLQKGKHCGISLSKQTVMDDEYTHRICL